jgi:DNA oxidative demethylase
LSQIFLSREEEHELLSVIQALPFHEFKLHGVTAKRRVPHFGFRYALEKRVLSNAPEPPAEFASLRAEAAALAGSAAEDFSQILNILQEPVSAGIMTRRHLASSRAFR